MQIIGVLIALIIVGGIAYMYHPRFGAKAEGERLKKMQSKPNYKGNAFDNIEYTPALAEGVTYFDLLKSFFLEKKVRVTPTDKIPVVKTNLHNLPINENLFVWFGHSSYLMQIDGKRILVDPVFSKYATPVRISVKAFEMEYNYLSKDIPAIDILVITHDHWDHLDYNTFQDIKARVKHIITGLGVGAHLEKWGYPADQITELYWGESAHVDGIEFTSTPSRHFSGRTFKRNVTLWSSFVMQTKSLKVFIGGDSGYGNHFETIGNQYGPFDYVILENGQYNEKWRYIHMMPEEVVQASKELKAKYTIPVHSSKFPLATHPWDEPLIRICEEAAKKELKLVTPRIGQVVDLTNYEKLPEWWTEIN